MLRDAVDHPKQRVLGQKIVVVHQRDPGAGHEFQCTVGSSGNMAVLRTKHHLDAWVRVTVELQDRPDFRRRGCIVRDAQLPMRIELRSHRLYGSTQMHRVRVVGRHQYRNQRRRLHCCDTLRDGRASLGCQGVVGHDPVRVVVGLAHPAPQFPHHALPARLAVDAPCLRQLGRHARPVLHPEPNEVGQSRNQVHGLLRLGDRRIDKGGKALDIRSAQMCGVFVDGNAIRIGAKTLPIGIA